VALIFIQTFEVLMRIEKLFPEKLLERIQAVGHHHPNDIRLSIAKMLSGKPLTIDNINNHDVDAKLLELYLFVIHVLILNGKIDMDRMQLAVSILDSVKDSIDTRLKVTAMSLLQYIKYRNNYIIATNFADHLCKTPLLTRPTLLKSDAGYIYYPNRTISKNGIPIHHFIYCIMSAEDIASDNRDRGNRALTFNGEMQEGIFVLLGFSDEGATEGGLMIPIPGLNIIEKSLLDGIPSDIAKDITIHNLIRIILYIQSGDPDIRTYKNTLRFKGKSTSKVCHEDQNLTTEPVQLVGYNWKKDIVHYIEKSDVRGFYRNQRCGPGRTQTVTKWIKESVRTYKNVLKPKQDVGQ
jgi:hypothetical protein